MSDDRLQQAINRVCDRKSFYWDSRETKGRAQTVVQEVEIRLDLDASHLTQMPPVGWTLHKADPVLGAAFLRRRQSVTDDELRRLFVDALTLAQRHDGRFQSWAHGDALERIWSQAS